MSIVNNEISTQTREPRTSRYEMPATHILTAKYPSVVKIEDAYFEIWCRECGANTYSISFRYFNSLRGLREHCQNVHGMDEY